MSAKKPAPPPHSSSYYLEVVKDPELKDDPLPQPYRMLDKILNVASFSVLWGIFLRTDFVHSAIEGIIDRALENVSNDPKGRRVSRRSFRADEQETDVTFPSLRLDLPSTTCCNSSSDGSRLFVGDENGTMHVVDSYSGNSLGCLSVAGNYTVGATIDLGSEPESIEHSKKGSTDLTACTLESSSLQAITSMPLGATPDTGRHLIVACTRSLLRVFHLHVLSGCQAEIIASVNIQPNTTATSGSTMGGSSSQARGQTENTSSEESSKYVIKTLSLAPDGMFVAVHLEWPGGGQCQLYSIPVIEPPAEESEGTQAGVLLNKRSYKIPMPNELDAPRSSAEEKQKDKRMTAPADNAPKAPKVMKLCMVIAGPPTHASFAGHANASVAASKYQARVLSRNTDVATEQVNSGAASKPEETEVVVASSTATPPKKEQGKTSSRGTRGGGKARKGQAKKGSSDRKDGDKQKAHEQTFEKGEGAGQTASGETPSEAESSEIHITDAVKTVHRVLPEIVFLMAPLSPLQQIYYSRTDAFNEVVWKQQMNAAATAGIGGALSAPTLVVHSVLGWWSGFNVFSRYTLPTDLSTKPEENPPLTPKPDRVWILPRAVSCAAVDHSSVLMALGFADGSVQLWDIVTGSLMYQLKGRHCGPVTALSIVSLPTPVGLTRSQEAKKVLKRYPALSGVDRIVSGGADGEVRLFDAVTGEIISVLQPPADVAQSSLVLPDLQSLLCSEYMFRSGASIEYISKPPRQGYFWLSSIPVSQWTSMKFYAVPSLEMVISRTSVGLVAYGVGPGSMGCPSQQLSVPHDYEGNNESGEMSNVWYFPTTVEPIVCVGAGGMGILCCIGQQFLSVEDSAKSKHVDSLAISSSGNASEPDICIQPKHTAAFLFHLQEVYSGGTRGTVPELNLGNDAMMRMFSSVRAPSGRSKPRSAAEPPSATGVGPRPGSGVSNARTAMTRTSRTQRAVAVAPVIRKDDVTDQFEELGEAAAFRDASWHISAQLRFEQMTREQRLRRIDRREKELRNEERGKIGLMAEPTTPHVGTSRPAVTARTVTTARSSKRSSRQ